jgi:hypothetical protein
MDPSASLDVVGKKSLPLPAIKTLKVGVTYLYLGYFEI